MRSSLFLAVFLPVTAMAVPTSMHHQGRLVDANGAPIEGSHDVTFALYPSAQGGTSVWDQEMTLDLDGGYFSVLLADIDSDDLSADRWLSVSVDDAELLPRQALTSVPFALRAGGVTLSDSVQDCDETTTAMHGTLRYHDGGFEGCTPDGWRSLGQAPVYAEGGSVVEAGGWRIHTFTSSGTFSVTGGQGTVEVLVVAGGGGGGGRSGGGGGAGGVLFTSAHAVSAGQNIAVTVGSGGGGGGGTGNPGANGGNSSFGSIVALGGGGGGSDTSGQNGRSGGSGGGAQYDGDLGTGTSGQGNDGASGTSGNDYNQYNSGGGGGAGGPGIAGTRTNIGDGGPGLVFDISGSSTAYGGGGGGGVHVPCPSDTGNGGTGGGGNGGACGGSASGSPGVNGTGGGGGGGASPGGSGGAGGRGGNGIVIVRYPL